MPFFDKISELFTTWAPRHSSNPPQTHSPPSDATSDQIQRTQTSAARNRALPPIDSQLGLRDFNGAGPTFSDVGCPSCTLCLSARRIFCRIRVDMDLCSCILDPYVLLDSAYAFFSCRISIAMQKELDRRTPTDLYVH